MEIYNEVVRDLLSTDNAPLRMLDDPEVSSQLLISSYTSTYVAYLFIIIMQRGTIIEKLTEETLRDWNHLKELLSICEG